MSNIDDKTVASFGYEWTRFKQSGMSDAEACKAFDEYFAVFPWNLLTPDAVGFDKGCGSGRWARFVAPNVCRLNCVDPSAAISVARVALAEHGNVLFHQASVDASGLQPGSQDFGYSLGVLHHVPDTAAAIRSCEELLKPGAPLLPYPYYAFDNRPSWFQSLWKVSDWGRRVIHRLPPSLKHLATDIIAALVYWPLARLSGVLEGLKLEVHGIPLFFLPSPHLYTMRTDARDRFVKPSEQRFTRMQIESMMRSAGLTDLRFSESAPYWCLVGVKA